MTSKQPFTNGYVPTTDEVRADYIDRIFEYVGVPEDQVGADFDTWLARVQAEAWTQGWIAGYADGETITPNPYK